MTQQSCANFTLQRIGWDGDDGGYDADGTNYQCTCCGKQFQKLHALMQHQTNKATCMQFYNSSGTLRTNTMDTDTPRMTRTNTSVGAMTFRASRSRSPKVWLGSSSGYRAI
jgi:hypothetical protein